MALGAVSRFPGLPLKVVPVGLHYSRGHRFRGSVLVDYGEPIAVPAELVARYEQGGKEMHAACSEYLDIIHQVRACVAWRHLRYLRHFRHLRHARYPLLPA